MFRTPPNLSVPGLFVTGTDTGVGKTVIACAIAQVLRRSGLRVGVCKPVASGCRRDREGLVSEDAEALAHFADCRQPLDVINPIRFAAPLAPAVAAEATGQAFDEAGLRRSLEALDAASDCLLIEGVGGILVPLDAQRPQTTVLDLAAALRYPVVVVVRAGLGTLNHTAMTVRLLGDAGCTVAGLVINGYVPDASGPGQSPATAPTVAGRGGQRGQSTSPGPGPGPGPVDPSMASNRVWLNKMNRVPILATVPACAPASVAPQQGRIAEDVIEAVATTYWPDVLGGARSGG